MNCMDPVGTQLPVRVPRNSPLAENKPDTNCEGLCKLAAIFFGVPVVFASMTGESIWPQAARSIPAIDNICYNAFCKMALLSDDMFVLEDAIASGTIASHPCSPKVPRTCFFAGAPILARSGHRIGTLCLADHQAHDFGPEKRSQLRHWADLAGELIGLKQVESSETAFLSKMSHELRTPLNAVIGYAGILLNDDTLGARHREHAERIYTSGRTLLTVIDGSRAFSNTETGQIEVRPAHFPHRTVTEDTISQMMASAAEKQLELRFETESAIKAMAGHSANGSRVLLVDDIKLNRDLAKLVLELEGHTVDIAADGLEAVAAVQQNDYDLVLMDVQMPGMDGITATGHIRSMASPKGAVPIVAMTADIQPENVAACRIGGMDGFLSKPFTRMGLAGAINRWSLASRDSFRNAYRGGAE